MGAHWVLQVSPLITQCFKVIMIRVYIYISKCFANINSVKLVSEGNAIIIIPYFIDEETGQFHELTYFKSQGLYLV